MTWGEGDRLKVLFVEDLPSDAELALRALKGGGLDVESERVDTRDAFKDALTRFRPDIVISDYSMPYFDGMSAMRLAKAFDPLLPFIVLTGSMNEDVAVECMKAGASDYVIKEHMARLSRAVVEAIKGKNSERALAESEMRFHTFMERTPDGVFTVDEAGRYTDANASACRIVGYAQEELAGKSIAELLAPESTEDGLSHFRALNEAGSATSDLWHLRKDGSKRCLTVSAVKISGNKALGFCKDITDQVLAEEQRREMSERLGHYLATSPTVTYSMRIKDGEAIMQWVSENILDLLGYTVAESLEPGWWLRNVHASDRMRALGGISKLTFKGTFGHEYRFHRKDRSVVWLRDEMRYVRASRGASEVVATLTDISERKKVEGELSLKSQALEAAANAVVITDREGAIRWVNGAFEGLTGYSGAEVVGANPRLLKSGAQDASFYRSLWDTILSGAVWRGKLVNTRKDGKLYTEEMTITPVLDESRSVSGFIAIKSDVTERERSLERLEASLAEKEVLLREIHHRINNNMQLITSLLNLSSQKIIDPSLQEIIGGVSRRVLSIALVHEQFYASPDMARIDFLLYLRQLAEGFCGGFLRFSGKIEVVSMGGEVLLDLEKAIPAGLSAYELITNAMRHAYPAGFPQGRILVSLRRVGSSVELSARDWGVGLGAGFAADKADTLGMILLHSLAAQLRGKIEFKSGNGTEAILRFSVIR